MVVPTLIPAASGEIGGTKCAQRLPGSQGAGEAGHWRGDSPGEGSSWGWREEREVSPHAETPQLALSGARNPRPSHSPPRRSSARASVRLCPQPPPRPARPPRGCGCQHPASPGGGGARCAHQSALARRFPQTQRSASKGSVFGCQAVPGASSRAPGSPGIWEVERSLLLLVGDLQRLLLPSH